MASKRPEKVPTKNRGKGHSGGTVRLEESTATIPKGTVVMVVDEFGDLGVTPKDPTKRRRRRYFGYAVSITDRPKDFADLTKNNRRIHGKELKAHRDTPEGREKIAEGISEMNVDARAYCVDKDNPPKGWIGDEDNSSRDMNKLFRHSVEESLPEEGNVLVVVDRHTGHTDVDNFLEKQSKGKLKVKGGLYDSYSGQYSDLLQTHDYVAYAAGSAAEHKDRKLSDIIGLKFPRIKRRLW